MCSRLILLLLQCVCGFLRADSTEDRLFAQVPAQYLLTPRDHHKTNELGPPDDTPYVLYYAPLAVNGRVLHARRTGYSDGAAASESRHRPEKTLLMQLVPRARKQSAEYPSRYLEPPAPEAVSTYGKYRSRPAPSETDGQKASDFPRNHRPDATASDKKNLKKVQEQGPAYVRDHAPIQRNQSEAEETLESKLNVKKKSHKKPSETLELSADGDRIEFQIQGHEGPKTYIFGFDTGNGKNRQFRLEERLKDGTVKGHYGYYDARGKLRTIRYLAHPFEGYKEKHHESNNMSSEEE